MNGSTRCAIALAPLILASTSAVAQVRNGSAGERATIEEVVVTAQRSEQSLQEVPVAVTALSAKTLERSGVTDTMQLSQLAPGLTLSMNAYNPQAYIRGIGTPQSPVGIENAVATYVDGVYLPNSASTFFAFNNIERVEVLRGPQGTLFGRNATGGLIHIVTSDPNPAANEIRLGATFENYDVHAQNAYANLRITQNVAANFSFYNKTQGEGWGRNIVRGEDVNRRDEYGARAKLGVTPTDALSFILSADYIKTKGDLGLTRVVYPGSLYIDGKPAIDIYDSRAGAITGGTDEQYGASLRMDWSINDKLKLQSTSAMRYVSLLNRWDIDGAPIQTSDLRSDSDQHSYQQELVLFRDGEVFDLTSGLFYFDDIAKYQNLQNLAPAGNAANTSRIARVQTKSYAAFAQGTWALSPQTNATVGLRYTHDNKRLDGVQIATPGNPRPAGTVLATVVDQLEKARKFTWRLAVDHKLNDDVLLYASYNRGFKSGGFNAGSFTNPVLAPETLDAYELGLKSDLLERRLRFNVSAYRYDYKNIQLTRVTLVGSQTFNAAAARSYGAEFEARFLPEVSFGRLELTGSLALAKGKYTSFPNGPVQVPNPATCTPTPTTTGPLTGGNRQCSADLKNRKMVRVPDFATTIGAQYEFSAFGGDVTLSTNYYHSGAFYWEPSNRLRQQPYDVLNAEIAYTTGDRRYRVRAFGRNLTDSKYFNQASEGAAGDLASPAAPLTFGIGLDAKL